MEMQMSEYWYGYLYETIQFEGKNTIIVHPKDGNAIAIVFNTLICKMLTLHCSCSQVKGYLLL